MSKALDAAGFAEYAEQLCPPGGSWQATTAAYLQATSRRLADYFQHHAGYPIWRQP